MAKHTLPPLTVPTNQKPTIWNRDMIVGTWFSPIIGSLIGGFIGKARMERELEYGKTVNPPTFWNKTIMTGLLLAGIATLVAMPLLLSGPAMELVLAGSQAAIESAAPALSKEIALYGLFSLGATVTGFLAGGFMGKDRMRAEYNAAAKYHWQRGTHPDQQVSIQPELGYGRGTSITLQEAQQLESKLSDRSQTSFADKLAARDAAAPEQVAQR